MRAPTLLVMLVLSAFGSAVAQLDSRLRAGQQVRIRSASPEALVAIGKLASADSDSVVVDRGITEPLLRLSLRDISALEVFRRGKGAETSGMVVGTLGAVAGGTLYINWCLRHVELCAYFESDGDDDDDDYDDEDDSDPLSAFATVVLGFGLIGYGIGYALVPPEWQLVNLPMRVGVAPMQRGVGVYVSLPAPRFIRESR